MQDYSISKSTRKCAVSGRGLEPGESYISAIRPDGEGVKRVDIAAAEWKGPDDETIGWWRCQMPEAGPKKLRPAPNGVLLDTLSDLLERPGKESLAYLLALLLVRRRVLSEEITIGTIGQAESASEVAVENEGSEIWTLVCNADERKWNVQVEVAVAEQVAELRDELNALLFTEE